MVFLAGLIFFLATGGDNEGKEGEDAKDDGETAQKIHDLHQQEAIETAKDSIVVVADDDGNINANNLVIPWTINKSGGNFFLSQREGIVIQIDGDLGIVEVQG